MTVGVLVGTLGGSTGAGAWVATAASVLALVPTGLRWLRVAQREHYVPGACSRFALRWWSSRPSDAGLAVVALAGLGLSARWPLCALAPAAVTAIAPLHLSVRGRTSRLVWTRRLRSLAALWLLLQAVVVIVGVAIGVPAPLAAAGVLLVPVLIDVASALLSPVERRLGARFVRSATERLAKVAPVVVGVTGSYGKTSTKSHIAHLLTGSRRVVASPASFNNRAGLARAVNEQLAEGTEVFVAEMGTYGPGEIADLCAWCPPAIAVITAIGPVHLERFGSEERILSAKEEITPSADVVVLNVDDRRLSELANRVATAGKTVARCSGLDVEADVCVREDGGTTSLWLAGKQVAAGVPSVGGAQPSNIACAVAVVLELGVREADVVTRLATLPGVPNRLASAVAPSGALVIDDTFNSNPAGARAALRALARTDAPRRRVVVTPGMVELGRLQADENRRFGEEATAVATDLVIVGRTNQRALGKGAAALHPLALGTREQAVGWVRAHLGPGDAVLYENDLPDHYP